MATVVSAYLESARTILVRLAQPVSLPYPAADITVTDITTVQPLVVSEVRAAYQAEAAQTDLVEAQLAEAPNITHTISITFKDGQQQIVIPRNVLNEAPYIYTGDDLGNAYTPQETTFRLWAPTASQVHLLLFHSETGPLTRLLAMQPGEQGTWYVSVRENLANWYYRYWVTIHGRAQTAVDPYVKAVAVNAKRGMIVDMHTTDPAGWQDDSYQPLASSVDAVVYEVHVRDFSIDASSGTTHKGKYLAFTERDTRGPGGVTTSVDSLKELGISHIQVQPIEEFASVDEEDPGQYNWGYDPRNYNVPEGAYATTPHGTARITELKQMIQSLHREHIGVIMDVVYNHTFATHISDFDKIVPQYYYRTDDAGNYTNGSGTGNELASERPMVQKFMRDSLKYWTQEYHIDGFRFDLMALQGIDTMRLVAQDLRAINPSIILYGEPWTGGASALPGDQLLFKGAQKGLGLGVFNDSLRNGLLGSVFDAHAQGFATGAQGLVEVIRQGVSGSIHEFTASPGETVNYVTSHDNMTLWDKITASTPDASDEQRIKMALLAQSVVMTAQGIAFMHGGEEFLRSKGGNDNSYNAGDAVNRFDWSRKQQYRHVFNYYAGLIHLRRQHPAFRLQSAEQINQHLLFLDSPDNTLAFLLKAHANGDRWDNIIVIYNPNRTNVVVKLPAGNWQIAAEQDQVNEQGLRHVEGEVTVADISTTILYQE
jgi:pullulanase